MAENVSILSIKTDFIEHGEAFARARQQSTRLINGRIVQVEGPIAEIATRTMQEYTPTGKTGQLEATTETTVGVGDETMSTMEGVSGLAGVIQQYVIDVMQPAVAKNGIQYAPFVIQGHATRNPEIRTRPNPYPDEAIAAMIEPINAILDVQVRQIATDVVEILR